MVAVIDRNTSRYIPRGQDPAPNLTTDGLLGGIVVVNLVVESTLFGTHFIRRISARRFTGVKAHIRFLSCFSYSTPGASSLPSTGTRVSYLISCPYVKSEKLPLQVTVTAHQCMCCHVYFGGNALDLGDSMAWVELGGSQCLRLAFQQLSSRWVYPHSIAAFECAYRLFLAEAHFHELTA